MLAVAFAGAAVGAVLYRRRRRAVPPPRACSVLRRGPLHVHLAAPRRRRPPWPTRCLWPPRSCRWRRRGVDIDGQRATGSDGYVIGHEDESSTLRLYAVPANDGTHPDGYIVVRGADTDPPTPPSATNPPTQHESHAPRTVAGAGLYGVVACRRRPWPVDPTARTRSLAQPSPRSTMVGTGSTRRWISPTSIGGGPSTSSCHRGRRRRRFTNPSESPRRPAAGFGFGSCARTCRHTAERARSPWTTDGAARRCRA